MTNQTPDFALQRPGRSPSRAVWPILRCGVRADGVAVVAVGIAGSPEAAGPPRCGPGRGGLSRRSDARVRTIACKLAALSHVGGGAPVAARIGSPSRAVKPTRMAAERSGHSSQHRNRGGYCAAPRSIGHTHQFVASHCVKHNFALSDKQADPIRAGADPATAPGLCEEHHDGIVSTVIMRQGRDRARTLVECRYLAGPLRGGSGEFQRGAGGGGPTGWRGLPPE